MFEITKEFHLSASHNLSGLVPEHPCSRLHGHNYVITVHLASYQLDDTGFVFDYRALDPIKKFIDEKLDHRHLNDVIPGNPTAENIARYMYDKFFPLFPLLVAVSVSETEKTNATYRP